MSVGSGYEYYYVEEAPPPPFADDEGRETAAPSPVGSSSPSRSRSPRPGSTANPSSHTKGMDGKKGVTANQEGRVFVAAASTNNNKTRSRSPHAAAAAFVVPVGGDVRGRSVSPTQIQHTEYLGAIGGGGAIRTSSSPRHHDSGGHITNTTPAAVPLSEASGGAHHHGTAVHRSHSQVPSSSSVGGVGSSSSASAAGTFVMRRPTAPPQLPEVLLSSKSARRAERRRLREFERRFGRGGDHNEDLKIEGAEGEEGEDDGSSTCNNNNDDETAYSSSSLEEEPQPLPQRESAGLHSGRQIGAAAGGAPVPLPTPKPTTNTPPSAEGMEGKEGNGVATRTGKRLTPRRADDTKASVSTPRTTANGALVVVVPSTCTSTGGGSPPSSVADSSTPRTIAKSSVSPAVRTANQAAVAAAAPSLIHVERSDALKGLAAQHEHVVEARLEHAAEEKRSETHKVLATKYRELMAARAQLAAKEEKSSLRRRSLPVGLTAASVATPRTPPAGAGKGGNSNNNSPKESHSPHPSSSPKKSISIPTAEYSSPVVDVVGVIGKYTSPQQRFLAAEREALGANTTMIPVGGSVPPTAAAAAAAFDIEDDDDDFEDGRGGGGGGYREDDEGEMNYDGGEHSAQQRHYRHHHHRHHHHDPSSDAAALYVRQVVERANERLRLRRLSAAYMAEHDRKVKEEEMRRRGKRRAKEEDEGGEGKRRYSEEEEEGVEGATSQSTSSTSPSRKSKKAKKKTSKNDKEEKKQKKTAKKNKKTTRPVGHDGHASFLDQEGSSYATNESEEYNDNASTAYDYRDDDDFGRVMSPPPRGGAGLVLRREGGGPFFGGHDSDGTVAGSGGEGYTFGTHGSAEGGALLFGEDGTREEEEEEEQQRQQPENEDNDRTFTRTATDPEKEKDFYGDYYARKRMLEAMRRARMENKGGQNEGREQRQQNNNNKKQQKKQKRSEEKRHRFDGLKAVYNYKFDEEDEGDTASDCYGNTSDDHHHDGEGGVLGAGAKGGAALESAFLIRGVLLQGELGDSSEIKGNSSPLQEGDSIVSRLSPTTSVVAVPPQQLMLAFTYPTATTTAEEADQHEEEEIDKKEGEGETAASATSFNAATLLRLAAALALSSSSFSNKPKAGEEREDAIKSRRLHELQQKQTQLFRKRRGTTVLDDGQATTEQQQEEQHTPSTNKETAKNTLSEDNSNHPSGFYKRIIYHRKEDESKIASRSAADGSSMAMGESGAVSTFASADGTLLSVTVDADGLVTVNRSISEGQEKAPPTAENKTTNSTVDAGNQTTNTSKKAPIAHSSSSSAPPLPPSAILLSSTTTASTSTHHLFCKGINNTSHSSSTVGSNKAPLPVSSSAYLFKTSQTCLLSAQRCKYKAFSQMTKREQQRYLSTIRKEKSNTCNMGLAQSPVGDDCAEVSSNESSESFRQVLHDILSLPTALTDDKNIKTSTKPATPSASAAPLLSPPETHSHWVVDKEILAVESKTVVKVVTTDPNSTHRDVKQHEQKRGGGEGKDVSASNNPIDRTAVMTDTQNEAVARSTTTTSGFVDMNDISSVHRVASEEDTSLPSPMGRGVGDPNSHRPSVADVDADDDEATPRARHPSPSPPLLNLASLQQQKNSNGADSKTITNFSASAEVRSARTTTPRGRTIATPREGGGAVGRVAAAKKTAGAEEETMRPPKTPRDRTPVRATRSSSASATITAGDKTRIAAPLSPSQLAKQKQEEAEAERAEAAALAKKQRQLLVPTSELAKNTAYKEPSWMTEEKRKRAAEAEAEAQRRELAEENRKRAAENAYGAWRLAQKATMKKKKLKKSKKETSSERLSGGESSSDEEHNTTTRTDGSSRAGGMARSSRLSSSSPTTRSPSASPSTSSSPRGKKSTPLKKKKDAATSESKSSKAEEKEVRSHATVGDHHDDGHYDEVRSIFEELNPFTSPVITVAHLQDYLTSLLSTLTNANADETEDVEKGRDLCVFPLPDLVLRPVLAGRSSSFSGKHDGEKGANTSTLIGSSPPPPMKIGGKQKQSQKREGPNPAATATVADGRQTEQLHPHVAKAHLITVLKFLLLELRKSLLHRGLLTLQHDFPLADLRDFIAQPVRWKEAIVAASADNQTGNHWLSSATNKKGRGNFTSSSPIRSNSSAASTASSPLSPSSPSRAQHASPSPRKGTTANEEMNDAGTAAQRRGAFGVSTTSFSPNRLVVGGLELGIGRTKGGERAGVRSRSPFGVASVGFRDRGHYYVSEVAAAAGDYQEQDNNGEKGGENNKSDSAATELFPSSSTRARRGAKPAEEIKQQQQQSDPLAAPLFKDATTQAQCIRFISQYAAEKVLAVATGPYPATKEGRKGVNAATSSPCEALVSSTVEGFVSQCLELPINNKTSALSRSKSTSSSTPRKAAPSKNITSPASSNAKKTTSTEDTVLPPAEHAAASFLYASDPQGALEYFVDERAAAIRQLFALTTSSASASQQATLNKSSFSSSAALSRTSSNHLNSSTARSIKNQRLSSPSLRTTMCPFYHFLFDDDGHDVSHIDSNNGNDSVSGILLWGDQSAASLKTRANNHNASNISSSTSATVTATRGGVLSTLSERRLMQLILAKLAKDAFLVQPVLTLEKGMPLSKQPEQQHTVAKGTFTTKTKMVAMRYFRLDVDTLRQIISSLAANKGRDGGEYDEGATDDESFDVRHAPLRSCVVLAACCNDNNMFTAQGEVDGEGENTTDTQNKPEALVDLAVVSTYDTLLRSLYRNEHHKNEDSSRGERIVPSSCDRAERLLLPEPDDNDEKAHTTREEGEKDKDPIAFDRFLSLCVVLRRLLIGGPAPSTRHSVADEEYYTNPFFDNAFALSKAAVAAGLGAAIVSPIHVSSFSTIPLAPWVLGGVLSKSVTNTDKSSSQTSGLPQKQRGASSTKTSSSAAAASPSAVRNASLALLEAVYIPLLASYLLENDGDFSLGVEDEDGIEGEAW